LSVTITVDVVAGASSPQANQAVVSSLYELASTAGDNTATDETAINHRPSGADQTVLGGVGTSVDISLEGTDVDPEDAGALTFSASDPANGSVTGGGGDVQYVPDVGFSGIDSFTYTVTDGGGLVSISKTVTVYSGVRPLTGRVTDEVSGAPIAGVEVRLVENADPAASTFMGTAITGADGRYDLASVFPGKGAVPIGVYAIRFVDPTNDHHSEWWDDAPTRAAGTNTDLGALPFGVERDAVLTRAGRITGVVRSSAGALAPIAGLQVRLSRVGVTASSATTTDAGGAYKFELLTEGEYQLWFRDTTGEWVSEWSDEAATRAEAATVTVSVGGQVTIDEQLDPVAPPPPPDSGSISGTVRSSTGAHAPIAGVQVRLYKAPYTSSAATTTDENGQYSFTRLPAGDYKVWFRDTTGAWVSNYGGNASTLDESTALSVSNDSRLVDGTLAPKTSTPPPPPNSGVISGTVTELDGVTPIAGLQVRISVVGSTGSRAVTTAANGTYSFTKLTPGQYVVWFRDLGKTWYSEYHLDAATAATATPVTATDGHTAIINASLIRK
jgi:5-hydroxyisourate hydrolase-like protein (transthyretin family)